jgi:hypothetical protein
MKMLNMNSELNITPLSSFLLIYFYLLEGKLNRTNNRLENVKFQSEEANTDEYIKKYFQNYILENNHIKGSNIKSLCIDIDSDQITIEIATLKTFEIRNVYLPNELSEKLKKQISESKNSVYTSPDLYLEIHDGKDVYYESLELKSTKNNKIPGSSIQQVSPFEWVIFVKRNNENVIISTGHYINSITEKLPFPDRSPRPQIGFKTLVDWNKENRILVNDVLCIKNRTALNESKIRLLADWQDYLATEWLSIIKAEELPKNEKWFNNAIRKFAVKFLEYTEGLSDEEKKELKNKLNSLIK